MQSITIAIVADDPTLRQNIRAALGASYAIVEHDTISGDQDALKDIHALCLSIAGDAGIDALRRAREADAELPVVGVGTSELSSRALDAGAYDFVAAPIEQPALQRVVAHAVEKRQLSNKVRQLRSQLTTGGGDEDSDTVVPLRELERQAIARALRATKGSVTKAAKLLGIGRATLYRRLASPEMANLRPRRGYDARSSSSSMSSVSSPLAAAGDSH